MRISSIPRLQQPVWRLWRSERLVTRIAAVTGRFQPFHIGHRELVRIAAAHCDELIIGITNPDPGSWHEHVDSAHRHRRESNPFTYWQRHRMIEAALLDDREHLRAVRWTIVPFPLDRPDVWFDYIPREARQFVRVFTDWERTKARILREGGPDGGYDVEVIEGEPESVVRASAIRQAWARGESIEHLLPEPIAEAVR